MTTRTDQLFCIVEATGSNFYTRDSEVEIYRKAKALVLSLKQNMFITTGSIRRGQPELWWISKGYIRVMPSCIQTYLPR